MAQFPINDDNSVQDAVNYLLSGPAGLGQFFSGFSSYIPAYLTGNYRPPFTDPSSLTSLYVSPINLSTSELLDPRTFKFTFASTQSSIPFALGAPVYVTGTTNDALYGGGYGPIGVIECTTDYVICRTNGSYSGTTATGGNISYSSTTVGSTDLTYISTDCNAKVIVNGNTDRVFISAQLNNIISFVDTVDSNFTYTVTINRYIGYPNNDPTNPEYIFVLDKTNGKSPIVSQKSYQYFGLNSATNPLDNVETIFSTVIDVPSSGYYWYIMEVSYNTTVGDLQVTNSELQLRSLSAQVVKQ